MGLPGLSQEQSSETPGISDSSFEPGSSGPKPERMIQATP